MSPKKITTRKASELSPTGRYSFTAHGLSEHTKAGQVLMLTPPTDLSVSEFYRRTNKALLNLRARNNMEGTARIVENGQYVRVEITKAANTPVATKTSAAQLPLPLVAKAAAIAPKTFRLELRDEELPLVEAFVTALRSAKA